MPAARREGPRQASSIAFSFEVHLNEAQLDIFLRLMQAGGWSTPQSLALSAIQKSADHFDLDRPGVFLASRGKR
jgi:hypothetical protein